MGVPYVWDPLTETRDMDVATLCITLVTHIYITNPTNTIPPVTNTYAKD
jgi:hypothetical protein